MIKLNISEYTGNYAHLNGDNQDMPFTRFDIARAFMTVGVPKLRMAIRFFGFWRFAELFFKSRAYINIQNGNYQLSPLYRRLDPSEQRSISYFFGQAFTKLYAEQKLNCIFVDNIHNHKRNIQFHNAGVAFRPKHDLYTTTKTAKEPDLIGIQSNNRVHILEAKAYSSGFNGSEFQHAINQVSRINTVNGQAPLTKTACFFDLSGNPIVGKIVDPDDEDRSLDLRFNLEKFKINYYSFFNINGSRRRNLWQVETAQNSYALFQPMNFINSKIYYGLEMNIFEQLNSGKEIVVDGQFRSIAIKQNESLQNVSIGADGIILLEKNRNLKIQKIQRNRRYN